MPVTVEPPRAAGQRSYFLVAVDSLPVSSCWLAQGPEAACWQEPVLCLLRVFPRCTEQGASLRDAYLTQWDAVSLLSPEDVFEVAQSLVSGYEHETWDYRLSVGNLWCRSGPLTNVDCQDTVPITGLQSQLASLCLNFHHPMLWITGACSSPLNLPLCGDI